MAKLREAITFLDNSVEERQASAEDHMTKIEEFDFVDMTASFWRRHVNASATSRKMKTRPCKKTHLLGYLSTRETLPNLDPRELRPRLKKNVAHSLAKIIKNISRHFRKLCKKRKRLMRQAPR